MTEIPYGVAYHSACANTVQNKVKYLSNSVVVMPEPIERDYVHVDWLLVLGSEVIK